MTMDAQQLMMMVQAMGGTPGQMQDAMSKAQVLADAMKRGDLAGGLASLGVDPAQAQEALKRAEVMSRAVKAGDLPGALAAMGLTPEQVRYALDASGAARAGKTRAAKMRILSEEWKIPDPVANTILLLGPAKGNA